MLHSGKNVKSREERECHAAVSTAGRSSTSPAIAAKREKKQPTKPRMRSHRRRKAGKRRIGGARGRVHAASISGGRAGWQGGWSVDVVFTAFNGSLPVTPDLIRGPATERPRGERLLRHKYSKSSGSRTLACWIPVQGRDDGVCGNHGAHSPTPSPTIPTPYPKPDPRFRPHPPPPCHTFRTPAAGWIANVSDQAGGRPFGILRNVRQVAEGGGGHRGSAGGRSRSTAQSQPPGRQPFSHRRHGGSKRNIRSGPVADMTGQVLRVRVRAGSSKPTPAVSPDRGRSNPGGGP